MAWFSDNAACLDYLDWIRWKDGFECPSRLEALAHEE